MNQGNRRRRGRWQRADPRQRAHGAQRPVRCRVRDGGAHHRHGRRRLERRGHARQRAAGRLHPAPIRDRRRAGAHGADPLRGRRHAGCDRLHVPERIGQRASASRHRQAGRHAGDADARRPRRPGVRPSRQAGRVVHERGKRTRGSSASSAGRSCRTAIAGGGAASRRRGPCKSSRRRSSRRLAREGVLVIACGGGGIAVERDGERRARGCGGRHRQGSRLGAAGDRNERRPADDSDRRRARRDPLRRARPAMARSHRHRTGRALHRRRAFRRRQHAAQDRSAADVRQGTPGRPRRDHESARTSRGRCAARPAPGSNAEQDQRHDEERAARRERHADARPRAQCEPRRRGRDVRARRPDGRVLPDLVDRRSASGDVAHAGRRHERRRRGVGRPRRGARATYCSPSRRGSRSARSCCAMDRSCSACWASRFCARGSARSRSTAAGARTWRRKGST